MLVPARVCVCPLPPPVDWFKCWSRGGKIYTPVHVLPIVLFKLRALTTSPTKVLSRTAVSIAHSTAFIATYQYIVKMTACILRSIRRCVRGCVCVVMVSWWCGGWRPARLLRG